MSPINFAVSTATAHSLATLSAAGHGSKLTASIDGDWCGTKVPHPPIPHALEVALRNSRFEEVMLNPQPLPPGPDGASARSAAEQVMINPQPLPPGAATALHQQIGRVALDNDWCGTVPRHFPPPPPPIADLLGRGLK